LAFYNKLPINRIHLHLINDHSLNVGICLLGTLADDMASVIKPDEMELKLGNGYPRELLLRVAEVAHTIFLHELGS
ncbi:hypothetical protein PFISCL1PPCAC_462, partial [Pristionchus fissidentatus]